jgi:hypothetical protein
MESLAPSVANYTAALLADMRFLSVGRNVAGATAEPI